MWTYHLHVLDTTVIFFIAVFGISMLKLEIATEKVELTLVGRNRRRWVSIAMLLPNRK